MDSERGAGSGAVTMLELFGLSLSSALLARYRMWRADEIRVQFCWLTIRT